jgi:hypothetical protein
MKATLSRRRSTLLLLMMAVALVCGLFLPGSATAATNSGRRANHRVAYVDVSVASLWAKPGPKRTVDKPSLTNPVHIRQWLDNMTLSQKHWLIGKMETQALYGQKVYILKEDSDWVKVAVPGQPTQKNNLGYPGWMPTRQLKTARQFGILKERKPFVLTDGARTMWLYDDSALSHKFKEISFNTRLPVIQQTHRAMLVVTPTNGPKWLKKEEATVYRHKADIPYPSGDDLVKTAKMFTGLDYLWAGRSGFGFDCSGFVSTVYQANGVIIPRDASKAEIEWSDPERVSKENLKKGDIIFYAHDKRKGRIHHDGMVIGDGMEIDAPMETTKLAGGVEIVPINKHRYADQYWGAVRYLQK